MNFLSSVLLPEAEPKTVLVSNQLPGSPPLQEAPFTPFTGVSIHGSL